MKSLLLDIQDRVTRNRGDKLNFQVGEQIVMRFIGQFGALQNEECFNLKRDLVKMESSTPGRVDIQRFHASGAKGDGGVGFIETASYLRRLGALDESVKNSQTVIIPNYINGPSNYISSGRHFSVVCKDECEDLFGHIERRVGGPEATASEVLAIVMGLSPREGSVVLDDTVVSHLQEIAEVHGGKVPLHGRLFALWLHHVYPRDCPYPALAGTTSPIDWKEFESETHLPSAETLEEMEEDAAQVEAGALFSESIPSPLPWDLQEDLLGEKAVNRNRFQGALPITLAGAFAILLLLVSAARSRTRVGVVDPAGFLDVDAKAQDAAPVTDETLS